MHRVDPPSVVRFSTMPRQFIQFDTEGNIIVNGNSRDAPAQALCIKCHANMAERDFVFSTFCNIGSEAK